MRVVVEIVPHPVGMLAEFDGGRRPASVGCMALHCFGVNQEVTWRVS